MYLYRIANLVVASNIALPSARCSKGCGRPWRLAVSRRGRAPRISAWYHHERNHDGSRWRSLARDGDTQVIRFWRAATFTVSFAARRITCYSCRSASLEHIRQLFIGHVLPLIFAERGALALHASAVRTARGIVVFVGETRRGKSTLAAALGARGCALVADDCAIVEVVNGACRVRPMNVGLRLWFGDTKRRLAADRLRIAVHARPAPLRRVYLLQSASGRGAVSIDPVPRADAVVALLGSSFQLDTDRRAQMRRSFEQLTAVASSVPVRRLRRPHGLRHLPRIVERVLEDAATD